MMWRALLLGAALGTSIAHGDVDAQRLASLRQAAAAPLAGFTRTSPDRFDIAPGDEASPIFESVIRERWFHGSSELRYSAMLFRSRQELETWASRYAVGSQASVTFAIALPDGRFASVRPHVAGLDRSTGATVPFPHAEPTPGQANWMRPPRRGEPYPAFVVAGRILIISMAAQHPEARRRDAASFRHALSDSELRWRAAALVQRLTSAAMDLRLSAGPPLPGSDAVPAESGL